MIRSPARMPRPNSVSLRASQITEFSGLPSTASPRPVATIAPLISTVASIASNASPPSATGSPSTTVFCCALSASASAICAVKSPRVSMISSDG